jgi:tetratricopeptide (TPR) repeat protein
LNILDSKLELQLKLSTWTDALYRSDYRVRSYLRRELERKFYSSSKFSHNIAFQLAICWSTGFGGLRNTEGSQKLLLKSAMSQDELNQAVRGIHSWGITLDAQTGAIYNILSTLDLVEVLNLPDQYRRLCKLEEAEARLTQEITDTEASGGEHSRATITLVESLASLLAAQSRWKEVEELELRGMLSRKANLGPEHLSTIIDADKLAATYWHQGRWEDAAKLELEVLSAQKRNIPRQNVQPMVSMSNLMSTYIDQGFWDLAEDLQDEITAIRKNILGRRPKQFSAMSNFAASFWIDENFGVEEIREEVLDTRMRVHGLEHRETLGAMNNLAFTYWKNGRFGEADELVRKVFQTRKDMLGHNHPDTLTAMGILASVNLIQGRLIEAETLWREVMEMRQKALGRTSAMTLLSMDNLGLVLARLGKLEDAAKLQQKVMDTNARVPGTWGQHPLALVTMSNLAETYHLQGKSLDAVKLMDHCARLSEQILGAGHHRTISSFQTSREWQVELGLQNVRL